jgi:hypothetical protein
MGGARLVSLDNSRPIKLVWTAGALHMGHQDSLVGQVVSGVGVDERPPKAQRDLLTVGELVALLSETDPTTPVVIPVQYGGFSGKLRLERRPLRLNVNRLEGFGPHDVAGSGEREDIIAVAIVADDPGR